MKQYYQDEFGTVFKVTEKKRGYDDCGYEVEAFTEGFSDGFIVLDSREQLVRLRDAITNFLENGSDCANMAADN